MSPGVVNIESELDALLTRIYRRRAEKAPAGVGLAVAFVSSTRREGTTTIVLNLVRRIAMENGERYRICLVDANYDNPELNRLLEQTGHPGLTDYVMGNVSVEEILHETQIGPSVALIPFNLNSIASAPLQVSTRLPQLLSELKTRFDLIVVDCSPVLVNIHVYRGVSEIDDFYVVVRAHSTQREVVKRALTDLQSNGCPVQGVILNQRQFIIPRVFY
ncbi:MAG: CpsD/CapB family tyrosine-protein kinase [Candidatus Sumerlaeota bacterium]|nr:CpsD/CapB family tyrosine-protein kinase [Candidatus Sumerlaeota bacterium]